MLVHSFPAVRYHYYSTVTGTIADTVALAVTVLLWGRYHNLGQKVNEAFARLTFGSNRRTYSVGNFAGRLVNPRSDFLDMVVQRYATCLVFDPLTAHVRC